jgi:subtilisin family serine protease
MQRLLSGTVGALIMATAISYGQSPPPDDQSVAPTLDETPQAWFVELVSPPAVEGTATVALEQEEETFHDAAARAGVVYAESQHFRSLWNGLTIRARSEEAGKLRALPQVAAVYPVLTVRRTQQEDTLGPEDTPGTVPDLVTALGMTGADVAQNELGLSGRGVRVAVVDSGVDYDHPDLGGCFGRGCRVSRGWDFVGDAFNADPSSPAYNPVPSPDPFPDDCDGHGTHVAGIIGANGTIRGVAPGVRLHAYRVFGCAGATTTDLVLDAMERAFSDGADVLNLSLGAPYQWPQYPTAQAAGRLVRNGMIVVASAGNDGGNGLYASSAPGVGRNVIAVASFDNTNANLAAFTISPDDQRIGYEPATGVPPAPTSGTAMLARTGTTASASDACAALPPGSLTGRVALIRRGTCAFTQKAVNAQAAGADGVVFYNNTTGRVSVGITATVPPVTIPVVTITAADGAAIDERLAGGSVTMTWTDGAVSEPQTTANLISSFSSWGPAPDLSLRPDLGAPGGSIRSTLPLELGGFGSLSGTSMASPYVAGAVALLLEARPWTKPIDVIALLQNNATPHAWNGNPSLGLPDMVHRQGAGMLTIDHAILAESEVTPSRLALGEFESASPVARRLNIRSLARPHPRRHRHGDRWHDSDDCTEVTYTLGHEPAPATGESTFAPTALGAFASVSFSEPTVTVGHGDGDRWRRRWRADDDRDDVVVTITPPAVAAARLFGGYVTLTPDDGGPMLRVPYLGYNGDYQAIQALTPTPAGFPWLARLVGSSLVNQPNGATFTLAGTDRPFILFHLDHQIARLRATIIDAATGERLGFSDREAFVGRNSTAASFFALQWDGTFTPNRWAEPQAVPNGTYLFEIRVLKALGDPRNPAHRELWTSPPIGIARVTPTTE